MKFVLPNIEFVFDFAENNIYNLIIESQSFFRELIEDINGQLDGEEGKCVISQNGEPMEMSKYAELIDDFAPFEINRKSLLAKLNSYIEKKAVNEELYVSTQELLGRIASYLTDVSLQLPFDVAATRLTVSSLIKAIGLEIPDDYDDPLERILDYFEIMREIDRDRLFIMVNMRSFFNDDSMARFANSVAGHDFHLLLIESTARPKLPDVPCVTIDSDLCEF